MRRSRLELLRRQRRRRAVAEYQTAHRAQLAPAMQAAVSSSVELAEQLIRGQATLAGVPMNGRLAMQLSAVYGCVRIISDAISQLPLEVRRVTDGGRGSESAPEHPLYRTLSKAASPTMTATEHRGLVQHDIELYGNGISQIVVIDGEIELYPIEWYRVQAEQVGPVELRYTIHPKTSGAYSIAQPEQIYTLSAEQVLHMRGPFGDGLIATAPVRQFAELFGTELALAVFTSSTFRNGARLAGALQKDVGQLSPEAATNLRQWVRDEYEGAINSGKLIVLEDGLKWVATSMSNRDATLPELKPQIVADVARVYSVPLHMLASNIAQPRANMEQQAREFLQLAIAARALRWTQQLDLQFLADDPEHFVAFDFDQMVRADAATRGAFYQSGISSGWLLRNEAREAEGMRPLEGLDEPLQPLNMGTVGAETEEEPDDDPAAEELAGDPEDDDAGDDFVESESRIGALLGRLETSVMTRRVVAAHARNGKHDATLRS